MEPNAVDLKAMIDLVRRRYLLIVGALLLCLAIAGVSLLVLAPAYTATSLVMVEPGNKDLLARQTDNASSTDALRVDSEVELVTSEATLLTVARELRLDQDAGFADGTSWRDVLGAIPPFGARAAPGPGALERLVVDRLRGVVEVQRRGLTFLIAISARAARPERAAQIANAVARTYIRDQLDAKVRAMIESRDIVAASLERAGADVARSDHDFDAYIEDNIQRIGEATGRADLEQLRQEIAGLTQSRASAAASVDAAEDGMAAEDWSGLAAVIADEGMSALEQRRLAATARLAAATTAADEAATLQDRVADIEAEMRQRAAEAVAALRVTLAGQQTRISDLRSRLRRAVLDGDLPADVLAGLYARQQGAEIARQQYQTLLARKNELDTQAILQVADSRLVSQASPPSAPSFPSPRLFLLSAVIAGLALGLVLALLVEYFVGGITSMPQAEAVLRVPALASIPRQRALRRGAIEVQSVADTLVTSPLSAFSESIRRLRIGLDQAMRRRDGGPDTGGRVVVVASAAPAEGRTTVALALARAYALSGVSTLLIDCDLRKPTIHKLLGMGDSDGLLDYLAAGGTANADLKSIIAVDGGSGARVILGARRSNMVTDQLIASATFARLIEAARGSFEIIILDTPPIGAVVDGLYLAGIADAIAFVVRWSSTPQQDVRAAVTALGAARRMSAPILTVVNQDDRSPATRRGKYADYYAEA